MATRRATVRDRNRSAIAGPTAPETSDIPAQPQPATPTSGETPQGGGAERDTVWLSVYLRPEILEPAKAAYMADWMNGGTIDNFPAWVGHAVSAHQARDVQGRADVAARRPGKEKGSAGKSRTFKVDPRVSTTLRTGSAPTGPPAGSPPTANGSPTPSSKPPRTPETATADTCPTHHAGYLTRCRRGTDRP